MFKPFKISLKTFFSIVFGIQIILVLILGGLILTLFKNQNNLAKSRDAHTNSYLLADELRQSSDDLTRLARSYVATGNPEFEREYWAVLDIRNGKIPRPVEYDRIYWDFVSANGQKPRPDGETISLHDLMVKAGFTKEEFAKLEEAQKNSDGLVWAETVAMNAVKGLFDDGNGNFIVQGEPDFKMANELMNNEEYYKTKAQIMRPIDEFYVMFNERTNSDVAKYLKLADTLFFYTICLVGCIALMFLLTFIVIRKQITKRERAEKELIFFNKDLEKNVEKRTAELEKAKSEVEKSQEELQDRQRALLNVLDDVEWEKRNVQKEKDKIDAILHSIGDGVFVVDSERKIIMLNKVTSKISGFSEKELLGKKYNSVLKFIFEKDEKENDEFINQAIATGNVKEMANHTLLIRKDGGRVPVADSAAPLKDKGGKVVGCVVVFRDVTKEREVDRMKTEFVSLASHQLRTPLTSIKWYSELLLTDEKKDKLKGEKKEFIQEIHGGNERMINLVNDLLNVSHIETGKKFVIEKKDVDIVPIVLQAIKEQEVMAKQKNIKIVCENKPSGEVIISADGDKIKQVLQNFINNAVKYSPAGSIVTVGCQDDPNQHIFYVKDQGVGIPKDQQTRIFEKFFRASNVLLTEAEGTGLGLYIAKSIAEGHGGKIWFESVEKQGTTFYFSLPKKA